jgi:hypothetical protein
MIDFIDYGCFDQSGMIRRIMAAASRSDDAALPIRREEFARRTSRKRKMQSGIFGDYSLRFYWGATDAGNG